jgi:hypothetical protein
MTKSSRKTSIINIKTYPKMKKDYVYIGRGSPFGNSYIIGKDGSRDEVCEKYKKDFYKKIKNERFRRQVLELKGEKLACHCKPEKCHGDIIVEYLEGGVISNEEQKRRGEIQGW